MAMADINLNSWPEVSAGMVKAADQAVAIARQTDTKLALWIENKLVMMTADEWENFQNSKRKAHDK